jgi:5-methylcytosine-specific restriction endonuclease McrA
VAPWPYSDPRWAAARAEVLEGGPTCRVRAGCRRPATEVDHWPVPVDRIRRGGADPELAFDPGNLRPACKSCNSAEGARLTNRRRGAARWDGDRRGRGSRRW